MHLVSVIIPTYNRASLLTETINSVLAQTYPVVEIIVVDDGSADNTAEVVAEYGDRVTYLQQENQGETIARNLGIQVSKGAYLSFLDDDDLILPTKIEKQVQVLVTCPQVSVVYCRHYHVDEKGNLLGKSGLLPEGDILLPLALGDFIWSGAPLIRRECVEAVGGYDANLPWRGKYGEDWDLWLQLALAGYQFACVQEPLGAYRLNRVGQTAQTAIKPSEEGNLATLQKLFSHPNVSVAVVEARNRIYSACYLWLSSRYYVAQDWPNAQRTLREAVIACPELLVQPDEWLEKMMGQALSYRVTDPIAFVQTMLTQLPPEAEPLRRYQIKLLSRVHTLVALRHYSREEWSEAQAHLRQAIQLDPAIVTEPTFFAETVGHNALHLPVPDPQWYVVQVLDHLPEGGQGLKGLRPRLLGQVSLGRAFEAYANQQRGATVHQVLHALRYQPVFLKNRGVLSILLKSLWFRPPRVCPGNE